MARADRWYETAPLLGIIDAGREPGLARDLGADWDRALFLWQEIQPNGPDDWELDRYLDRFGLHRTLASGIPLVGVVQGTPAWAGGNPRDGAGATPTGLDYAVTDPRNHFGRFMMRLADELEHRVHGWIIWNEPDFRPGDSGSWWTWSGNTEDLFKLIRTGYRAVKEVNPRLQVVFPATTYWVDQVYGRELFLSRVLREMAEDPEADLHGFYFDAVAVNLYCSPGAVYEVHRVYSSALQRYGLDKPLWLTETNCPIYNDAGAPVAPGHHLTTSEQAGFLLQTVAMARAAGYEHIGWYSMLDHDPKIGILDRWGLLRPDGSPRPAYQAFKVARRYLGDPQQLARFAPLGPEWAGGGWRVWRVVVDDLVRGQRVQVLWRQEQGPRTVRLEAESSTARVVDVLGRSREAHRGEGGWEVDLPPTRVRQPHDPSGYPLLGDPVILVEDGVPVARLLSDPPAMVADFR